MSYDEISRWVDPWYEFKLNPFGAITNGEDE